MGMLRMGRRQAYSEDDASSNYNAGGGAKRAMSMLRMGRRAMGMLRMGRRKPPAAETVANNNDKKAMSMLRMG